MKKNTKHTAESREEQIEKELEHQKWLEGRDEELNEEHPRVLLENDK
jgi:hypothetical protein